MDTKQQIANAVKGWLRANQISINEVAARLGKVPQAITNAMNSSRPFSRKFATALADEFGFSVSYLLTGEGSLFPETVTPKPVPSAVILPPEVVTMFNNMTDTIKSQQDNIAQLSHLVERQLESGKKEDEAPRSATHSAHL